jgi:Zn-dependent protease
MPAGGFTLFRVRGIRIAVDFSWFIVLFLIIFWLTGFYQDVLDAPDGDSTPYVLAVASALLFFASILLHELGHAFAGRLFNAQVSYIELTGIGGVAHFEHSLPRSAFARSVISLAGPAVNLGLWLGLDWLAAAAAGSGNVMVSLPLMVLASANFVLMLFNLLPAYPLDGGHTLDAWLGALLGPVWSVRIVAGLGLVVAVGLALYALPTGIFLLLVALFLAQANWQALQSVGGWR